MIIVPLQFIVEGVHIPQALPSTTREHAKFTKTYRHLAVLPVKVLATERTPFPFHCLLLKCKVGFVFGQLDMDGPGNVHITPPLKGTQVVHL
jgi:hypothetical protein